MAVTVRWYLKVAVTLRCCFDQAVTVRCCFDQAVTVRCCFDQAVTVRCCFDQAVTVRCCYDQAVTVRWYCTPVALGDRLTSSTACAQTGREHGIAPLVSPTWDSLARQQTKSPIELVGLLTRFHSADLRQTWYNKSLGCRLNAEKVWCEWLPNQPR